MYTSSLSRIATVFGICILVLGALFFYTQSGTPQALADKVDTDTSSELIRTITVVGEGTVHIKPDIAQAVIGIETIGESVGTATDEASTTMAAIMAALKAEGIAEKDMQTTGYSVWADRHSGPEGRLTNEPTYRVTNQINVTIRDLDAIGDLLDAAIEAGANSIHGIRFSLDEQGDLQEQAREMAAADARAKAAELAGLHEAQVGEVISISEVVGSGGGYYDSNFARMESASMGYGGSGPVSPGELELSLRLQVVYAMR